MQETNQSELSLGGQKPLWISTQSLQEDKDELMPILKEETNDYSNDVIWTCSPASDFGKCKPFCQGGWEYANINHMDGIEAACVVVFGVPTPDSVSLAEGQTHLSRLFTRARNSLIIITEEKVTRYLHQKHSIIDLYAGILSQNKNLARFRILGPTGEHHSRIYP